MVKVMRQTKLRAWIFALFWVLASSGSYIAIPIIQIIDIEISSCWRNVSLNANNANSVCHRMIPHRPQAPAYWQASHISTDLRPISLLPRVAQVLESFIGECLFPVLNPTFDSNQFTCRRMRSTTLSSYASWVAIDTQPIKVLLLPARVILVDFKTAFDSVNHNALLIKLYQYQLVYFLPPAQNPAGPPWSQALWMVATLMELCSELVAGSALFPGVNWRSRCRLFTETDLWFLVSWARLVDCAPWLFKISHMFLVMQIRVIFALPSSLVAPSLVPWAAAPVAYPSIHHWLWMIPRCLKSF